MKISGIDDKYTNTDNYLICYFDLLGTKNKLKIDEKETFTNLWFVNNALKNFSYNRQDAIIRTFSEYFFIALPIDNDINIALRDLVIIIGNVYAEVMVNINMFIRGYITRGEMHIDESTIIGAPLIKAYKYESEVVKYPRICIDFDLIGIDDKDICDYTKLIYIDNDLMQCINVLKCIDQEYLLFIKDIFSKDIISNAKYLHGSELAKNLWVINYINEYFKCNFGYKIIDIDDIKLNGF